MFSCFIGLVGLGKAFQELQRRESQEVFIVIGHQEISESKIRDHKST